MSLNMDTSQKLRHVFACDGKVRHMHPGFLLLRKGDIEHCPDCGAKMQDVTQTQEGQVYLAFARFDLGENTMSLFKRDTSPLCDFAWTHQGFIEVTTGNKKETYSEEALRRLANSKGMSTDQRNMAMAALEWTQNHPFTRSSYEFKTTPSFR